MAFGTRPAGTTTRSDPKVEYFPLAVENIAKGVVVYTSDAGFITIADAATSDNRPKFVTVEAVDNSGGSAGDLAVGIVGAGQHVTVTVSAGSATLAPGDGVQVGTTDGEVALYAVGGSLGLKIGTFLRKEGGIITKNATTPFTEEFFDGGDYSPDTAVAGDVIEIRIDG